MKLVAVQLHVGQMVAEVHVARQKLQLVVRGYEGNNLLHCECQHGEGGVTVTTTFGHSKTSGGSCLSKLCSKQIEFKLTNDDTEK